MDDLKECLQAYEKSSHHVSVQDKTLLCLASYTQVHRTLDGPWL